MKKLLLPALLVWSSLAYSQNTIIKLWPGAVPGETSPKHVAVLRNSLNHVKRITDITDPLLTVFKPLTSNNLHTGIIVSPGGGNKYLAIDLEGDEIAQWLSKKGYTAFVLQYRVPMKQAGAEQDIQRAVRLVRSKATAFQLDTGKIGVMGFSAGGNLSARACTQYNLKLYTPADTADSLSAKPNFGLLIYPGSLTNSADHQLIPEVKVDKNTPPVFISVASDDQYGIPFLLAAALRESKVPFELHVYPKGGHGYGLRPGNPAAETWPALALKWLKQTVK
ncbi:MAG: alpha/beta hydrolase [Bacteroidota bacterium]